ncbi:phenylalanine--tRNA ligase subunit beta [Ureaplasma canigenitalium]|uniref:phenylalanine--tRNA ligase subunit beta n=1 Tax=Ureaplasma canigenitalium TaxID=42092 RepID=UPI0004E26DE4|nr:phenylalanine--tRNA ligase subunit beta [Ureaplasma canigenitalium]
MLLSLNLLKTMCPKLKHISYASLESGLMNIGCEIEQVINHTPSVDLAYVKVISKEKIDNTFLNHVVIDYQGQQKKVVTKADNFQVGDIVVYAPPNSVVHHLLITLKEIYGQPSDGMLVGYTDLSPFNVHFLSSSMQEEIIVMNTDEDLEESINKHFNLDDTVLELSLPSNRNDLNGYLWLTKELCAYFGLDYYINLEHCFDSKNNTRQVTILSDLVYSYNLVEISRIDQMHIEWFHRTILINNQIKLSNTFADVGNYLTLKTANPLHTFDASKVVGAITVRHAEQDEVMVGLDGKTYEIKPGDIIIKDEEKTIALAGIIGSKDTMVDSNTTKVLMEIANFNNKLIRMTANRLKMHTKASMLFSKPLSSSITTSTVSLVLKSFQSHAKLVFHYQMPHDTLPLANELASFPKFVGAAVNEEKMLRFLNHLGYHIDSETIIPPIHRYDVLTINDVFEDVLKKFSINNLPKTPIKASLLETPLNKVYLNKLKLRTMLVNLGINEAHTYNLGTIEEANSFNFYFNEGSVIEIANPLSKRRAYLKLNNLQNLLEVLSYNASLKNEPGNWFEISQVNIKDCEYFEEVLSVVLGTDLINSTLTPNKIDRSFQTVRSLLDKILSIFNLNYSLRPILNGDVNHAVGVYDIFNNLHGIVGRFKRTDLSKHNIPGDVWFINLKLTSLLNLFEQDIIVGKPYTLHDIDKDFTAVINETISHQDILSELRTVKNVTNAKIIDKHHKNGVWNYTYRVSLNALYQLTTEDIQESENDIKAILAKYSI